MGRLTILDMSAVVIDAGRLLLTRGRGRVACHICVLRRNCHCRLGRDAVKVRFARV